MANHKRHNSNFRIIYLFLSIFLYFSFTRCGKDINTEIIDISPIVLNNEGIRNITKEQAVLVGSIDKLNDEKILDYGIIINEGDPQSGTGTTISLGSTPAIGPFEYNYQPKAGFLLGDSFTYFFYIKTEKDYYKSHPVHIVYSGIKVYGRDIKLARSGDTVRLDGEFNMLDDRYTVNIAEMNVYQLPITLSTDGKTLSFILPDILGYDNHQLSVTIDRYESALRYSHPLTSLRILPKVLAPEKTDYYYSESILFAGPRDDFNNYNGSLRLIIDEQIIPYNRYVFIESLSPLKEKFKVGYMNERDSILFSQEYTLKKPTASSIVLKTEEVHLRGVVAIDHSQLSHYYSSIVPQLKMNQYQTKSRANIGDAYSYDIGDIPVGRYTITLEHVIGNLSPQKTVSVTEFKYTVPSPSSIYIGDEISINGNFIEGQRYIVTNSSDTKWLLEPVASKGRLSFQVKDLKQGASFFRIGYSIAGGQPHYNDQKIEIDLLPSTFDSIYPSKASPGDLITLKGKRIKYAKAFYLGGIQVTPETSTDDEIKFLLPSNAVKGKNRIAVHIGGEILTASDYIEVY